MGPFESIQAEKVDLDHTMQLVQLTRHLAAWLVLDVPSTYDDLFFRSLAAADQIVFVADQTVAGIRGVQLACESLGQRHPVVVINRFNARSGLSVNRIEGFLPGCDICTLPIDLSVPAAMGQPVRMHSRRSSILSHFDILLEKVRPDPHTILGSEKHSSILSRLGHALHLS